VKVCDRNIMLHIGLYLKYCKPPSNARGRFPEIGALGKTALDRVPYAYGLSGSIKSSINTRINK
jgi:hypothetical protein